MQQLSLSSSNQSDSPLALRLAERMEIKTEKKRIRWESDAELIIAARKNPSDFISYTVRDDETGRPVNQSWFHVELQGKLQDHQKIVVHAQAGAGKTTQAVNAVLYEMGKNPMIRVLFVSAIRDLAVDLLGVLRDKIDTDEAVQAVFPNMKPKRVRGFIPAGAWTADKLRLQGNSGQTPTVQAAGIDAGIIGRRYDLIVIDDPHTLQTASTAHQRSKIIKIIRQQILSRVHPKTRVWMFSNAWHKQDAAFTFGANSQFHHEIYSADQALIPDIWTPEALEAQKLSIGSVAYQRMYLCKPVSSSTEQIPEKALRKCIIRGIGFQDDRLCRTAQKIDGGYKVSIESDPHTGQPLEWEEITIGLDPATVKQGDEESHDRYAFHVLGRHPITGKLRTLYMESGHANTVQILERVLILHQRYEPDHGFWVEDNGQQQHLIDMARDAVTMQARCKLMGIDEDITYDLRICNHNTGGNKIDPNIGIPSLAIDFESEVWELPDPDEADEIESFIEAAASFAWEGKHTADELMAAWIARKAIRSAPAPSISFIEE